jgi:hypothetical protein
MQKVLLLPCIVFMAIATIANSQTLAWSKTLDLPEEFKQDEAGFSIDSYSKNRSSSAIILRAYSPVDAEGWIEKSFLFWFSSKGDIIYREELSDEYYHRFSGISSTKLALGMMENQDYDPNASEPPSLPRIAIRTYTRKTGAGVTFKEINTIDDAAANSGSPDLSGFFSLERKNGAIILKRYHL